MSEELLELCGSENLSLDALQELINCLGPRASSSQNQLCLLQAPLCLLHACGNKKVTLEIVQLLHSIWAGALPIHQLCHNKDLDDTNSIDILRFMLSIDSNLSRVEMNESDYLPIHYAVANKSTAFCKELIDAYPESLRIVAGDGLLPIHFACIGNRDDADTIQYMLELDSELINQEHSQGNLPIHFAAMKGSAKSIELLLKFDPDALHQRRASNYHCILLAIIIQISVQYKFCTMHILKQYLLVIVLE